jgi:flagellar biogenesis protein FliO
LVIHWSLIIGSWLFRRGLAFAAGFLAATATAFGQTNLAGLPTAPLPDVGFSVFRVLGALIFVLALFFAGVWLFRNWQRLMAQKGRTPKLLVLEAKSLGNRHAIYVVGYEQQRLMLASSPTGVTLISHLPTVDTEAAATVPVAPPFAETLQRMLSQKR